jgi:hypothetical protein
MTSYALDDTNVLVIGNGQISPGCPTAGAVLDGYNEPRQFWSPVPTLPRRDTFPPIILPTLTQNPWKGLHPGSFILFQLDKRELALQHLVPEDSELFERCLAFPAKRYVGLVLGTFSGEEKPNVQEDSDVRGDPHAQEYTIALVGKSLSPASRSSSEPDLFTVQTPPTIQGNINGRQPLNPKPISRVEYYRYTVFRARVAPTHIYHSATKYALNMDDLDAFDSFAMQDRMTLDHQRHNMSSISGKDVRLWDPMDLLPVKVWYGLTDEKECHDPKEFAEEAQAILEELARAEDEEMS